MIRYLGPFAVLLFAANAAHAQALGLKDLPDDVRATVKKELARQSGEGTKEPVKEAVQPGDDGKAAVEPMPYQRYGDRRAQGCSLSIGAAESASRVRRDVLIVATKPIVQTCR